MLASANSIAMEGRSKISPALRNRLRCPKIKSLNEYDSKDFLPIISEWLKGLEIEKDDLLKIADDFCELFQDSKYKNVNLRSLKNLMQKEEFLADYLERPPKEQKKFPLSSILSSPMPREEAKCQVYYKGGGMSCVVRGRDMFDSAGISLNAKQEEMRSLDRQETPSFYLRPDVKLQDCEDIMADNIAKTAQVVFSRQRFTAQELERIVDYICRISKITPLTNNNSEFYLRMDVEHNFDFVRKSEIALEFTGPLITEDGSKIYNNGSNFLIDLSDLEEGKELRSLISPYYLNVVEFIRDAQVFVRDLQERNAEAGIYTSRFAPETPQGLRMHDINLGYMAKAKELIIDQSIIYPRVDPRGLRREQLFQ